jgi:hypothetical protein
MASDPTQWTEPETSCCCQPDTPLQSPGGVPPAFQLTVVPAALVEDLDQQRRSNFACFHYVRMLPGPGHGGPTGCAIWSGWGTWVVIPAPALDWVEP